MEGSIVDDMIDSTNFSWLYFTRHCGF